MKLLGIGDNVFDHYRWRKELYPGGNSVNVPVLARRYDGSETGYIGLIADDREGRHFLKALDEEGLDVSRVRMMHGVTARNYIEIDEQGDRHFVGNNGRETAQYQSMLMLTPVDYAMMEQYDLVHTSIHSWLDMYHVAMSRWAPLSMDFSGEYTRINMGQLCPLLRFAFFSGGDKSEEEVRTLAKAAVDNGAKTAVVTMGMRGSYLLEKGREHRQEAHAAQVVDALGAGDSFIAAFLARYHANGGDLEFLRLMDKAGLLEKLVSYKGWNTNCNTLGTTLAQGVFALAGQDAAQLRRNLLYHLLDDGLYQALVRAEVLCRVQQDGLSYFDLGGGAQEYGAYAEQRLLEHWRERLPSSFSDLASAGFEIWFPWNRLFEIGITWRT